jgi:NAD(P)-dependent dehydrogenase (short-subunit alcohol dehydrogenase family)
MPLPAMPRRRPVSPGWSPSRGISWATAIEVNLMAHVRAARLLVQRWVERSGGRFVVTASATGLLAEELRTVDLEPVTARGLLRPLFAGMNPDPEMFRLVDDLRARGIRVGLLSEPNVIGPTKVGLHGIHHRDPASTLAALAALVLSLSGAAS